MTKQIEVLRFFTLSITNKELKYHIYIDIQTFYSVLSKSTFGSNNSRVFLGMTPLAWHACIWRVFPIILCRSSQALSVSMGSVTAQLFSRLSRDVWLGSCPGSGWATQGHSKTCPEVTLGCVLRVVFLLEGEQSPQSEVLSALEQVFIKDLCVLCSVQLSLNPDWSPSR